MQLQAAVQQESDLTVSSGLSLTKCLAKIASDYRKPNGITAKRGKHIHLSLKRGSWFIEPHRPHKAFCC